MTTTDVDQRSTDPELPPSRGRSRSKRRRRWLVVTILLAILILPVLVFGAWFWYQTDPPGGPGAKVQVEVRPGWGVARIADELTRRKVIGSSIAFQLYVKVSGAGPFQAGSYQLRKHMGSSPAADVLERSPTLTYRKLALIPGLTLDMIADRVGRIPGLSRERFLEVARSNTIRSKFEPANVTSLEGLTWPDTYYVSKADTEETLLKTLVTQFDDQATKAGLATSADPYRTVIVASLIQTEAKLDVDRPLIAAVVENRLRDGMPLQIDATLLYARGSRDGPITDADVQRDSPYNTYRNTGLPPTPISTVTRTSIEAALHPADVHYKFYVLINANGKHAFATTFEEHQRNVAEARRKGLIG
ncbi:MAG: endolytic transglycosylase MltG [Acidimicrobiia bacterium]